MTAYIRIREHGETVTYHGRTVWSIIRRIMGRGKDVRLRLDHGLTQGLRQGYLGWSEGWSGMNVAYRVIDCEGPFGTDNEGEDWDEDRYEDLEGSE